MKKKRSCTNPENVVFRPKGMKRFCRVPPILRCNSAKQRVFLNSKNHNLKEEKNLRMKDKTETDLH